MAARTPKTVPAVEEPTFWVSPLEEESVLPLPLPLGFSSAARLSVKESSSPSSTSKVETFRPAGDKNFPLVHVALRLSCQSTVPGIANGPASTTKCSSSMPVYG